MPTTKKTVILGASDNPNRYSYLALKSLRAQNHPVIAIGRKKTLLDDVEIMKEPVYETDVNTITLYLNPKNQKPFYDYIIQLHPERVIFNPGTENNELIQLVKKNNIKPVVACTLVMLSTGQY